MFETDCAEAFSLIQRFGAKFNPERRWISECANLLQLHHCWNLSLVRREANGAADSLAKKAVSDSLIGGLGVFLWLSLYSLAICCPNSELARVFCVCALWHSRFFV